MNPKGKFQEALKLFDNRDFRGSKKACEKILEKSPTNEEALALKGLAMCYLQEKVDGKACINQAIKINMKSSLAWHYYGIYQKEEMNYPAALKCYWQAHKNDTNNMNIIRDLAYLQLFLRELNSFVSNSRKLVDLRPDNLVHWVTYAFSQALVSNYDAAFKILEKIRTINKDAINKQGVHEIIMFSSNMLNQMGKYEETANYLLQNKTAIIDKVKYLEGVVSNSILAKKYGIGMQHIHDLFKINADNIGYFIWYFTLDINNDDFTLRSYDDILSLKQDYKYLNKMYEIISKDLKSKYPKSKIVPRLELALSTEETFKHNFTEYFLKNVKITLPSIFKNVQFIYKYQQYKIPIISSVLNSYTAQIESLGGNSTSSLNEELNNSAAISWIFFFVAQHYLFLGEHEQALSSINQAIDRTPSVVEFYMIKSKILRHCYMLEEATSTYNKAKILDLGDRYLNAKQAKNYVRKGDIEKSLQTMLEYTKDPLSEENVEYYQCMWYENECADTYLINQKVLHSHYLFKNWIKHFIYLVEDQSDFYNFCLRRYMLNDWFSSIKYFDIWSKNKYVFKAIKKLDLIYMVIKSLVKDSDFVKENETKLLKEYEEMKHEGIVKYKYTTTKALLEDIENDMYKILKKIQTITPEPSVHFYCLKYYLIKGKVILALKSLKFLRTKHGDTFYYFHGFELFRKYIEEKKAKIEKKEYYEFIKEEIEKYSYKENEKWCERDSIWDILFTMYREGKIGEGNENAKQIEKLINSKDWKEFRLMKSEDIQDFISFTSVFWDFNGIEDLKKRLREKLEIKVNDNEVLYNISLYEDKTDYGMN